MRVFLIIGALLFGFDYVWGSGNEDWKTKMQRKIEEKNRQTDRAIAKEREEKKDKGGETQYEYHPVQAPDFGKFAVQSRIAVDSDSSLFHFE